MILPTSSLAPELYTGEDWQTLRVVDFAGVVAYAPGFYETNKTRTIPTSLIFVHGGNEFPVYIAFHSYLVGVEVLLYREATATLDTVPAYHGSTARIVRISRAFWSSLEKAIDLFAPRGQTILHHAHERFEALARRQNDFAVAVTAMPAAVA